MLNRSRTKSSSGCKPPASGCEGANPSVPIKKCSVCGARKPITEFDPYGYQGGHYKYCSDCRRAKRRALRGLRRDYYNEYQRKYQKARRQVPDQRARFIVKDTKKADRARGRECDIDVDFVSKLIAAGCLYCGGKPSDVKMSLDRVDNDRGHTKENVVPSCVGCNLIRSNMPFRAWKVVARAVRQVREEGLLAGWVCRNRK